MIPRFNDAATWKLIIRAAVLPIMLLVLLMPQQASTQEQTDQLGQEGMPMSMDKPQDSAQLAKLLADKRESEFNHRLAGVLVIVAGVFMLFHENIGKRLPSAKYVWPATFLVSGIFLLVWSDTELWPFGNRQWLEALSNNVEVRQHKTYAVLLLGLGLVEWLRANGTLRAAWSRWVFPAVATAGSILLLFHEHGGGMHGPNHMAVMERIKSEHLSFAITGFTIGLTNGLSGTNGTWRRVFSRIWPVLMVVLGVLLLFYRE